MKMKILVIVLFVLISGSINAQTYQKTDYGVKTVMNSENIESFVTDGKVEIKAISYYPTSYKSSRVSIEKFDISKKRLEIDRDKR